MNLDSVLQKNESAKREDNLNFGDYYTTVNDEYSQ